MGWITSAMLFAFKSSSSKEMEISSERFSVVGLLVVETYQPRSKNASVQMALLSPKIVLRSSSPRFLALSGLRLSRCRLLCISPSSHEIYVNQATLAVHLANEEIASGLR